MSKVPETQSVHSNQRQPPRAFATIGLLLLLCLPAILVVGLFRTPKPRLLVPGDHAPAFTARSPGSPSVRHLVFGGKPTALLFFSTDCPHCVREISNFDRLGNFFGDKIEFLSISTSDEFRTSEFVRANRLTVPAMIDPRREGAEGFGVEIVPALFLIGIDGAIVYAESGEKSFSAREKLLLNFSNTIVSRID